MDEISPEEVAEYNAKWRTWNDDKGHVWELDEDGVIDIFAYESGYCNGPRCTVCGYAFCHHCEKEPLRKCEGK